MSETIKLIIDYTKIKDNYDGSRNAITRLENELAKALSEPKISNLDAEPGGGFSNDKIFNKVNKQSDLQLKLNQEQEIIKIYEKQYNSIRNEIISLFKEYECDKHSSGKDKNMFYIFYYRKFKKYVMPFEQIAQILGISSSWCIKTNKDLEEILNNLYKQFSKSI